MKSPVNMFRIGQDGMPLILMIYQDAMVIEIMMHAGKKFQVDLPQIMMFIWNLMTDGPQGEFS